MSKLTSSDRASLPKSQFAGPGRSYPIPDVNHARLALSGASRAESVGNITPAQKATIDAKAKAKLGGVHPREHSLAMASASHLHKAGYISGAKKAEIHAAASQKLAQAKQVQPAPIGALGQAPQQPMMPQPPQGGNY